MNASDARIRLHRYLKELCLPTMRECVDKACEQAGREGHSYDQFLADLLEREVEVRSQNRIDRLLQESHLPMQKSFSNFDLVRLPTRVIQQISTLREGSFLDRRENVLAFGNPGSGKTHLLCALCQELVRKGRRVLYANCSLLVQELLIAKRDLTLSKLLKRLGRYDAILLDDLGYVQQSRDEMEVLFTLLAERYERGSVLVTSNLPFSRWDSIFKDAMTTAAAIDRLVHHSVILELNLTSYRMEQAHSAQSASRDTASAPVLNKVTQQNDSSGRNYES